MNAKIWNFPKRENSTAIPPGNAPWEPDVYFKRAVSMENPTLTLGSERSWEEISNYNYLALGNEYYFINEWRSLLNDMWECDCELDVLATYRTQILETSAFVEYDTSTNPGIPDHRLSQVERATYLGRASAFSPAVRNAGSYIITVTGINGSVGIYALSQTALGFLMESVVNWATTEIDGEEPVDVLKKWGQRAISGGNAAENIRSCIWVPWLAEGTIEEIYLGRFPTGQSGRKLDSSSIIFNSYTIPIPWQASDWRACALCHTFTLYLPFVGNVGISAEQLLSQTSIEVYSNVDVRTGDVAYIVQAGKNQTLGCYSGNASATIPIGVSNINPFKTGAAIMSTVASITSGSPGGVVGGLAETAKNILVPNVTSIGSLQSSAGALLQSLDLELWSEYKPFNVEPSSVSDVMGTPTMSVKSLSSVNGYVKCRGASVSANTGRVELSKINSYLNGGVYIE